MLYGMVDSFWLGDLYNVANLVYKKKKRERIIVCEYNNKKF